MTSVKSVVWSFYIAKLLIIILLLVPINWMNGDDVIVNCQMSDYDSWTKNSLLKNKIEPVGRFSMREINSLIYMQLSW